MAKARGTVTRRSILFGAAGAAGAVGVGGMIAATGSSTTGELPQALPPRAAIAGGDTITPDDPRYLGLTTGNNQRFVARPEYIRMITSSEDAEAALRDAVRAGKRVSLRSGGHCFSDFVCNPETEVILDMSRLTNISYDASRRAFAVEAGARLMDVYEALFEGWGVTIPGGICYSVGTGGHIAGGGYGLLSRDHGLTVDHLYAVEVVVVDAAKQVRTVVATRERTDPNRDLWWGHTGGGGGNFGLVTRYWFRSPDAIGTDPSGQLVSPPSTVLVSAIEFPWAQLTEAAFTRLLKNFGAWHEQNSAPSSPYTKLSSLFNVSHKASGSMGMFTQVDASAPNAAGLLTNYLAAVTAGTGVTPQSVTKSIGEIPALPGFAIPRELPWLQATRLVGTNNPTITNPTSRGVHKSGYMRQNFSDAQVRSLYRNMSGAGFDNPDTMLVLFSFGGQVNAMPEGATANAQRSSAFKMCLQTFWPNQRDDGFYLNWARRTYGDLFQATGGVPVPGTSADGCYINYPDNDVANPTYNRSGVPWQTLYYKGNYPRLQQVKCRWDPGDVFRHALSIEPAR